MGLLEPDGRHRGGNVEADVSTSHSNKTLHQRPARERVGRFPFQNPVVEILNCLQYGFNVMVLRRLILSVATAALLCNFAVLTASHAHHSYVTKYNPKKPATISGVISSVSYSNPHIFFTVQTSGGTWRVETESIPKARARGLTPSVLKAGKKVRVSGWRARSGGGQLGMRSITFIGGKTITMRRSAR